jgi:hypothetical protein
MPSRLPASAFESDFRLGRERSYQQIADQFSVSKKTVAAVAKAEGWRDRVASIEQEAARRSDYQAIEDLVVFAALGVIFISILMVRSITSLFN